MSRHNGTHIERHTRLDLRLAWRPSDTLELSLTARNLYAQVKWRF